MDKNQKNTNSKNQNNLLEKKNDDLKFEILSPEIYTELDPDITFKIIVLGNSGVGKSCLSLNGTTGKFESNHNATVGFDFFSFVTKVDKKIVRLQIWDTCGEEGYRALVQNFYRGSVLAILVYAINDINSFNSIENWIKQLKTFSSPDIKIFLIGNKCDLNEQRQISLEMGMKMKKDFNFEYFLETSAKTGLNSQKLFIKAFKLLYLNYKKINSNDITPENNKRTISLVGKELINKEKKKKCC
jgi:small GTP-binding protein